MEEEIRRIRELTEENNQILRGMRRHNRMSAVFKAVYWIVIIALSYGAFVAIQPYLDQLKNVTGGVSNGLEQFNRFSEQLKGL